MKRRIKLHLSVAAAIIMAAVVAGFFIWHSNRFADGDSSASAQPEPAEQTTNYYDNPSRAVLPGGDRIFLGENANRVQRRDAAGHVKWTTLLTGYLGSTRPPHLQADAQRVYITHNDGVTALDAGTGATLWHSPGPADRMLLSGDLLLAADCRGIQPGDVDPRLLLFRSAVTGQETRRVELPRDSFDALPIREVAGLFLVQRMDEVDMTGTNLLVDRNGLVQLKFDRFVISGVKRPAGRLFLTSHDVTLTSDEGKIAWSLPFSDPQWIADGGLLRLPDGDWMAFIFCQIANSGVEVIRFNPDTGRKMWETDCAPLPNVTHSKYEHTATVTMRGSRVTVNSQGSAGTFVEVLSAATGTQISRQVTYRWGGNDGKWSNSLKYIGPIAALAACIIALAWVRRRRRRTRVGFPVQPTGDSTAETGPRNA